MKNSVRNAKPSKNAALKATTASPSKLDTKGSAVQVVESGSCPTLTGASTLGYDVGRDNNSTLFLRIRSNSAQGKFNKHWVPLNSLMDALGSAKGPITSGTLRTVCKRVSANQGGFLLAVFAHKGLVQRLPNKLRGFALGPTFQSGGRDLGKPASGAPSKSLKAKAKGR